MQAVRYWPDSLSRSHWPEFQESYVGEVTPPGPETITCDKWLSEILWLRPAHLPPRYPEFSGRLEMATAQRPETVFVAAYSPMM